MNWVLLNTCLLLAFFTVVTSAYSSYDDSDDVGFERGRRGWSMMRLGRGLQMLRLGKRSSLRRMQDKQEQLQKEGHGDNDGAITGEQIRAILSAMLDETRDREQARRMPPLPRYGRELEVKLDSSDDIYPPINPDSWPRSVNLGYSSHFPGSRFKRSTGSVPSQKPLVDYLAWADYGNDRVRAVAMPRYGRYLGRLYKIRPAKAVPAPRIGRQEDYNMRPVKAVPAPRIGREEELEQDISQHVQNSVDSEQKTVESAAS